MIPCVGKEEITFLKLKTRKGMIPMNGLFCLTYKSDNPENS